MNNEVYLEVENNLQKGEYAEYQELLNKRITNRLNYFMVLKEREIKGNQERFDYLLLLFDSKKINLQ